MHKRGIQTVSYTHLTLPTNRDLQLYAGLFQSSFFHVCLLSAIYLYKQIISFGDIAYNTLHDISLPRLFAYATIGKTR